MPTIPCVLYSSDKLDGTPSLDRWAFSKRISGVWSDEGFLIVDDVDINGNIVNAISTDFVVSASKLGIVAGLGSAGTASTSGKAAYIGNSFLSGTAIPEITITPSDPNIIDILSFPQSTMSGGWIYGSSVYRLVNIDAFDKSRFSVIKSTDGGSTWAEIDKAGSPFNAGSEFVSFLKSGDTLYVFTNSGIFPGVNPFAFYPFNFLTEQWDTAFGDHDFTINIYMNFSNNLVKFDDGSFGVIYADDHFTGANIWYRRYSGSWAAPVQIAPSSEGSDMAPAGMIVDPDGTHAHLLYWRQKFLTATYKYITSSGSIVASATFTGSDVIGSLCVAGGLFLFGFNDGTNFPGKFLVRTTPLGSATFTTEVLPDHVEFTSTSTVYAFAMSGGPAPPVALTMDNLAAAFGVSFAVSSGGPFNPPSPPGPPDSCELNPTPPGIPTLEFYNEPLENQGT